MWAAMFTPTHIPAGIVFTLGDRKDFYSLRLWIYLCRYISRYTTANSYTSVSVR